MLSSPPSHRENNDNVVLSGIGLADRQSNVVACLDFESTSMDTLMTRTGLNSGELLGILLELEMEGVVATTLEGGYSRLT